MFPPNFVQPIDPNDPAWANCKAGAMALNVIAQIATRDYVALNCDNTSRTENSLGVVLQGATAPIPVCVQGEKDFAEVYKCDAVTGNTILIRTVLDHDTNAYVTTYYDLVVGADWTGNPATDLTECQTNGLESDNIKLCDDNGEFYRWFVKDNGEPTGLTFDTDLAGVAYTPVGVVGECVAPEAVPFNVFCFSTGGSSYEVQETKYSDGTRQFRRVSDNSDVTAIVEAELAINPDALVAGKCELPAQVLADHQNGCIERTIPGVGVPTCNAVATNYSFLATDFVAITVTANDGNGNYTLVQEMSNATAQDNFLAFITQTALPNSRAFEDIGPGILQLYWGNQSVTNIVDLSATAVQYDFHVQPGVTDAPTPLPAPCSDPIADQQYIDSATFLRNTFDSYTLNVPQSNAGVDINSTVTNYTVTNTGGVPTVTHIPAKQVITYDVDGNPVSDKYYEQGTLAEIVFDPATDVFNNICDISTKTVTSVETGACVLDALGGNVTGKTVVVDTVFDDGVYVSSSTRVINDIDGSTYTLQAGETIGECECGDAGIQADIVTCSSGSANVVTEGLDANLDAIAGVFGGGNIANFHPQLNSTVTLTGSGAGLMNSGINVNIGDVLYTGAQFTFNINLIADIDVDTQDFGVVVWDNVAGASVTATSITSTAPYGGLDPQGTGLNMPVYGYTGTGTYTVVWTGDLPQGDYTVSFLNQDSPPASSDVVEVSIDHNITGGGVTTTTNAQLVALDQCTIDALNPTVVPPIEVPNGFIATNGVALSGIAPGNVRSFSVKGLNGANYDISLDGGATFLTNIDGGDSWGEGNEYQLDVSQVVIAPTVSGDRVLIKWETV